MALDRSGNEVPQWLLDWTSTHGGNVFNPVWGFNDPETGWSPNVEANNPFSGFQGGEGWSQKSPGELSTFIYGGDQQILSDIARAAGVENFNWAPIMEEVSRQWINETGRPFSSVQDNLANAYIRAVDLAAQQDPRFSAVKPQVAQGSPFWNQMMDYKNQVASSHKDAGLRDRMGLASVLAAPLAAAYFAPAAGAAAGGGAAGGSTAALESGLAAYTPGAVGSGAAGTGAAGAFDAFGSLGTSLAGGLPTVPAELGAYMGTTGATAGAALGAGLGGGTAATTAATSTALQRILNGGGTQADWLQLGGQALPSLLSAWGSNQQAGALKDLAGQYMAMGAPYRQRLADISTDPSKYFESAPARESLEQVLRRLSVNGNPAGSPYSQALAVGALNEQYGRERDRLAGYGGLTQFNAAAPGTSVAGINANQSTLADIGYGIGRVMNPQPTLAGLLKDLKLAY